MHQYIGGQRRDATSGADLRRARPEHQRDDRDGDPRGARRRRCRGRRGIHRVRGVEPGHAGRALDRAAQGRPAARRARRGARAAREPPGRQADPARPRVRRAGHRRQHRVLRHRRPPPRRHGQRRVLRRPHVIHPPRADRRGGLDRPVELPPADGRLEGAACHRRRQHHRAQAGRDHPAHQPGLRRGVHRGRRPRRRRQRRHRHRPGRRPAPRRPPRRRDDQLHRLDQRRAPGDGHGIRHRQARAPRARGQGARSWCSTTPTSRRPCTVPSRHPSSTPARTAPPPPAPSCTAASTTRSCRASPT